MSLMFTINTSPFLGKEGEYLTSRHIRERLDTELQKNLALRVESTDSEDKWNVYGRGILHLSVLLETMRREGYELQVGKPQVIYKEKYSSLSKRVKNSSHVSGMTWVNYKGLRLSRSLTWQIQTVKLNICRITWPQSNMK